MLLRTYKKIRFAVVVVSLLATASTASAQYDRAPMPVSQATSYPNQSHYAPRTQQRVQPNRWGGQPLQPVQERVYRPLGQVYQSQPVVRGQQPGYGTAASQPVPQTPTHQGHGYATRQVLFAPPATSAGGQPFQPGAAGAPAPQPAGSGLGPVWDGNAWAQPMVQPVMQPPFVPQSPLVMPDEYADINVNLAETQTGRLVIGAGVNSDAGLVGNLVVDEQNFDLWRWPTSFQEFRNGTAFRGGGQRFRIEALPGTTVQRYSFNFTEPYLFQTAVSFGLSGFYFDRNYTDWDERRKGGRISLGYVFPQRPDLSTTFAVRYEQIGIRDPSVASLKDLSDVLGENDLLGLRWQVAHDTRDSTVLPTEGHLIQMSYEQVVGTFTYPKFIGDYRKYFVVSERPDRSGRHVLGLAARVGVSGKNTPIYDRFFAGGFSTIRGFDFRGASPVNSGVIVGGEFQAIGSAEYRFPLTASDQVFGSLFLDVGTVEEVASVTASDIRITPGFELRVNVPQLGPIPIAVGMGFPVQHEQGDDIKNFHFFVGISR